jgi:hypothetical protein
MKMAQLCLPFRCVPDIREGGMINPLSQIIIILLRASNFSEECISRTGIPEYSSPAHLILTCLDLTIQPIY